MNKNIVVISQRVDFVESHEETRDSLDHRLVEFVLAAGYIPSVVPNNLGSHISTYIDHLNPNYIILSGGNDIGSCPKRDATENFLVEYASDKDLPLLGICRGAQFIASFYGAKLKKISGHVRSNHEVELLNCDSTCFRTVNSYHNLSLELLPDILKPTAVCVHDKSIEALRHKKHKFEGWMWHPERNKVFDNMDIKALKLLFYKT